MRKLTESRKEFLANSFLEFFFENLYIPTFEEFKVIRGYKTRKCVYNGLILLIQKGYIKKIESRKSYIPGEELKMMIEVKKDL